MPVTVRFRCESCGRLPDAVTQRTLEAQLLDRVFGEYREAQPGGWLIWTGGGPLGSKRYACAAHSEELVDYLCTHYSHLCARVRAGEPFLEIWPDGFAGFDERDFAELLGGDCGRATREDGRQVGRGERCVEKGAGVHEELRRRRVY